MISKNRQISEFQFICFIVLSFFGINIITLPYMASIFENEKGYFLIFFGIIMAVIYALIMDKASSYYKSGSFYDFLCDGFNKGFANFIVLFFVIKSIFLAAFSLSFLVSVIKVTLLQSTPEHLISILMLLSLFYLTSKESEDIVRIYTILFILSFSAFFAVLILSLKGFDITNLYFYGGIKPSKCIIGSLYFLNMFNGIEGSILFSNHIYGDSKKPLTKAVFISSVLMFLITIVCYGKFSFEDLKTKLYPLLNIMDSIDFPGAFVERQDILVMNFFIVSVFAYIGYNVFCSFKMMSEIFPKKRKWFNILYILIFIISLRTDVVLLFDNKFLLILSFLFMLFFILFPILIITERFIKKGVEKNL